MDDIAWEERRVISRRPANTCETIWLRLGPDQSDILADVQDISISGMGIRTLQALEPGTSFLLAPLQPSRSFTPELRAEVRHARKCASEGFLAGCRFSRFLTVEDTMALS